MLTQITLNNQPFQFNESFLPCLITGAHKSGASYFSVTLIANLINQGFKVIFFTAFPMAKEELLNQIGPDKTFELTTESDLENIPTDKSIIIPSGNEELRQKVIQNIKHLEDYIIFVKNIEEYDHGIIEIIGSNKKNILSGDLDNCIFKTKLANKQRESKIIFTTPNINLNIQVPNLEKYKSYFISKDLEGILKLN